MEKKNLVWKNPGISNCLTNQHTASEKLKNFLEKRYGSSKKKVKAERCFQKALQSLPKKVKTWKMLSKTYYSSFDHAKDVLTNNFSEYTYFFSLIIFFLFSHTYRRLSFIHCVKLIGLFHIVKYIRSIIYFKIYKI